MTKPKGTRDKATLQKMENAAAHLEERREEKNQLYRKLDIATALIMASELRSREIKKQLHNIEKEIAELEKLKLEWDAREQKAADMQRIQELVNSLVDQGISAEEIIRELEK